MSSISRQIWFCLHAWTSPRVLANFLCCTLRRGMSRPPSQLSWHGRPQRKKPDLMKRSVQQIQSQSGCSFWKHFFFFKLVMHFTTDNLWHLTSLLAASRLPPSFTGYAPKSSLKSKNSREPGLPTPPGGHDSQTASNDLFNWHLRSWPKVQINSEVKNANRLYPSLPSRTCPDTQLSSLHSLLGGGGTKLTCQWRRDDPFPTSKKNIFRSYNKMPKCQWIILLTRYIKAKASDAACPNSILMWGCQSNVGNKTCKWKE